MAGQRPPRAAVRAAVRGCLADLAPGERVVVALSGGPDSLALTGAAVSVGAELGLLCEAVVVDHQLQTGSREVALRAAEQARILGCVDARVVVVDVASGAGSGGPEGAARAARYAALDAVAAEQPPAAAILLGHTREDQAETVLLGLARGSGTRSLAGMAARAGAYRRPLLDLPREVVTAAAWEAARADPRLEPWTDPHNADAAFARVRVRDEVLPLLEAALGPGIVEALARTATLAREDADALDAWADRVRPRVRTDASMIARARRPPSTLQQFGNELPQEQQQPSELIASELTAPNPTAFEPTAPDRTAPDPTVTERSADGEGGSIALPIAVLRPEGDPLPAAVVHRVVRRFLIEAGCPAGSLTAGHIRAVAALLEPGSSPRAEVALPGGHRAHREAGAVVVRV